MADRDAIFSYAGRAARTQAAIILVVALALGGFIRFIHLGVAEISGDEVASWRIAGAPTLSGVMVRNRAVNPGTLGLNELILHPWMKMFGDNEAAMRSLSAVFGTVVIALVFFVACELLMLPTNGRDGLEAPALAVENTAALSALIASLSLVMINYSREARMYALTLALVLAQTGFFLRAMRRGGWLNLVPLALLTALALAASFTAAFAFAAEGAWFLWRLAIEWRRKRWLDAHAWQAAFGVLAGLVLLAPLASVVTLQLGSGVKEGKWTWIPQPSLFDPVQTFESASGGWVFALLTALALWAVISCWRSRRNQIAFALIWMWLPVLAQLAVSYLFRPVDVTRYVLSSFIAFYILAALGIASLRTALMRTGAVVLLAITMLGHVYVYGRKPRDRQFREAVTLAIETAPGRERLGVVNWDESVGSALYYASPARRADLVRLPADAKLAADVAQIRIIILPSYMEAGALARYRALYPRLDGSFRRVEVRSK